MNIKNFSEKTKGFLKNKYVLIVLAVGLILILLPTGSSQAAEEAGEGGSGIPVFSLAEEEKRLVDTLTGIDGAGELKVLLSLRGGVERELAMSGDEALVVSSGSGKESAVELRYIYPEYLGAVIICEGGGNARVRLDITQAVQAFTGLGSNKITVVKMK